MADTATLLNEISRLADQLAVTIDDRFDFRLESQVDDDRMLKLVMMVNFLLERARLNIADLAMARDALEERVRERNALLELVIQGSNDGVWIWRLQADTLEVSPRFAELLGATTDTLRQPNDWLCHVHPADREALELALREYLSGVSPVLTHQYRLRDHHGGIRWMVLRGALQRDDAGNPLLLAGTQSDVTRLIAQDPESGLPNEQAFADWLETQLEAGSQAVLALCALDRMGELAETLEGPQLHALRNEVRRRILSRVPIVGFVAKLSGDVFGMGLPVTREAAQEVWQRLCEAFDTPLLVDGYGAVKLALSLGVTELDSVDGVGQVDRITAALWSSIRKARKIEGHAVIAFDEALREESMRLLRVEGEVRQALDEHRVIAFLQPIVRGDTAVTAGFEALVRIRLSDGRMLSPGEFIPVVETSELIAPLTATVMQQGLALLSRAIDQGLLAEAAFVAVNIAPQHLLSGTVPGLIERSLRQAGLQPGNLKIEITETALVANLEAAVEQLNTVRKLGCKVAIDDFGTGYSSLEYLQVLPADVLKLDRAFVNRIESSDKAFAIARTVCDLAGMLNLEVVAEGVEHGSQVAHLKRLGADYLQGFYFCRPLAPELVDDWLRQQGESDVETA